MADLKRRMDRLSTEMRDFLSMQMQAMTPGIQSLPFQMAALPVAVPTLPQPVSVMTTTPVTSGVGPTLYTTSTPISTAANREQC